MMGRCEGGQGVGQGRGGPVRTLPGVTGGWPVTLILLALLQTALGLTCYECYSTKNPDCGAYFKQGKPVECKTNETTCAIQRQEEIPGEQVEAIVRGCYKPGQVPGLNSSDGCRYWTNPSAKYGALYCFCETDLCNAAPGQLHRHALWRQMPLVAAVAMATLAARGLLGSFLL